MSTKDWAARQGKTDFKYEEDKYHRDIKKLTEATPYQKAYKQQINYF